jgi:acid phosphatase family membrane protein YuiD
MPSAHAASVATLATAVGLKEGFSSSLFALSAIVALIAMFDAQTWRRSIGIQARILNNIMDDVYAGRKVEEEKLRELIGHTPIEVFVGGLLGILVAFALYQ